MSGIPANKETNGARALNFLTLDPALVGDLIEHVEHEAHKRVKDEIGNLGMAVLVDEELGVVVVETFWMSGDAMRASERAGGPLGRAALQRRVATVSVEHYEMPSRVGLTHLERGAGVRLTRMDLDQRSTGDAVADYERMALPWLTETEGFCSAVLLVHRRTGRAVEEAVWHTRTLAPRALKRPPSAPTPPPPQTACFWRSRSTSCSSARLCSEGGGSPWRSVRS